MAGYPKIIWAVSLALAASQAWAEEAKWRFEWTGAGGYSMRGVMSYDPDVINGSVVREHDIICFAIEGIHDGQAIGTWSLGQLDGLTSWRLHFVPAAQAFVPFGMGVAMPQAWNMNGAGTDCGPQGFGFNIGNAAQDICVNGQLIAASQRPPGTPFLATRDDGTNVPDTACLGPMLLGGATLDQRAPPKNRRYFGSARRRHSLGA